ncbi:MAG: sulfopyruvate decarboxylase subunit alpha [Nitrospiraceae bacterium]|nr:MAG: sulfopyruvate decarboxylase subunit alpha [Nitrospiraceae bacterium]
MPGPEEELIGILKNNGVDFTSSLPCEKIKTLLEMVEDSFFHVPLTREEEGVGISAGAALSGKKPAMFVQSSGIGNMINALLSLTGFYRLPLAIFVSQRGIYKEKIAAQLPMGQRLPMILKGAGISYSVISKRDDFRVIGKKLRNVYAKNMIHAFLLSPEIWENAGVRGQGLGVRERVKKPFLTCSLQPATSPKYTRYEILKIIAPYLSEKIVVCNLGFPAKELFHVKHQPSNFYMLGSMGMTTPIGLGVALSSKKEVVVIDGDGSLLMNPGTLATAACLAPGNLTILAIDNKVYGSTGNQPTLTGACVDLEITAKGFGIKDTVKAATKKELINAMKRRGKGIRFIHALAVSGNRDVLNISLHHLVNKKQVMGFIKT